MLEQQNINLKLQLQRQKVYRVKYELPYQKSADFHHKQNQHKAES